MEYSSSMNSRPTIQFLELLAGVCKGTEQSMGLPKDPEFWNRFASRFSQNLQNVWTPEFCEMYATKLGLQYLNKDPYKDQLSSNLETLLKQVFVDCVHLLPAFEETQDVVLETPPDKLNPGKLVKRLEGSTSSVRNISQSEGSTLQEEVETEVRKAILEMADKKMLTIDQIEYAQNKLTRSTWVAESFLNRPDLESKRDLIIESMYDPEGLEMNKKKKRCM